MSTSPPFPPPPSSSVSSSLSFWEYLTGQSSSIENNSGKNNVHFSNDDEDNNNRPPNETTRLLGGSTTNDQKHPRRPSQQPHNDNNEAEETIIVETPGFIHQCQEQLNRELDRIVAECSPTTLTKNSIIIYKAAIQHSPDYIQKIKLQFLRCERFAIAKSARRLLDFLETKLKLFGPGYVGNPIRQSDLHPDDIEALRTGSFQFLSKKKKSTDQTTVLCYFPHHNKYNRIENILKAWWYLALAKVEEDDQTQQKLLQRRGLSILIFHYNLAGSNNFVHGLTENDRALYWEGLMSLQKLPIRLAAIHFCYNDFLIRQMVTLYPYYNYYWKTPTNHDHEGNSSNNDSNDDQLQTSSFFNKIPTTATVHFHDGSHTECLYAVLKHGIPVKDLPLKDDGKELDHSFHIEYLRQRKLKEKAESSST